MLHEPAVLAAKDPAFAYKRRMGVWMFLAYAIIYSLFIAINVIKPKLMESTVFAGLNLAVVYGFGLIVLALLMALIYNAACGRREKALSGEGKA
jgi:uncharacterized membrane protein (DUF485 family)